MTVVVKKTEGLKKSWLNQQPELWMPRAMLTLLHSFAPFPPKAKCRPTPELVLWTFHFHACLAPATFQIVPLSALANLPAKRQVIARKMQTNLLPPSRVPLTPQNPQNITAVLRYYYICTYFYRAQTVVKITV